tara:strand:+ start:6074 stop:7198 length:1125 start_codon:yes stop_codon:yes gene_type:complete
MAKIAFVYSPSAHWLGGKNYYLSLFSDLQRSDTVNQLYIFTGNDYPTPELNEFTNFNIIYTSLLNKKFARLHQVCNLFISENVYLGYILKKHKINYLSHSYISRFFGIKSVPWVPDFQHSYLPELFKPKELKRRNKRITRYLKHGDILVSSNSAYCDAHKFFNPSNNIYVYKFKPLPVNNKTIVNRESLEEDLNVKFPFVFLPNQFWKHKNHLVFFEAVAKLKEKGNSINVVCSGAFSDYRNPEYSSLVKQKITSLGLNDNVHLVGVVNRDIFNSLLEHSTVLVNPSLFEGWSTTVEEGKQSSKVMLLSNIPVHIEQVEDYIGITEFFDPRSVESCTQQLMNVLENTDKPRAIANNKDIPTYRFEDILKKVVDE